MKDEYIIINKTTIQKRIEDLESKRDSEHKRGHDKSALRYENTILELKQVLSQSTPLIPENIKPLQELVDEGYDPYDSAHHLQVQRMLKVIQDYISNLKLDI
jgi:hypothetical protein